VGLYVFASPTFTGVATMQDVSMNGGFVNTNTTNSTTTSTGAITTLGGLGVAQNVTVGSNLYTLGSLVARNITTGYMYNNSPTGTEGVFRPVLSSMKQLSPDDADEGWLVNPGYIYVVYPNANYLGTPIQTVDNSNGTVVLYNDSTNVNTASSVKVYWRNYSTEVIISGSPLS
jgi:hypothetical protein